VLRSQQYWDRNVLWPRRVLLVVRHVEYAPRALLRLEKYAARLLTLTKMGQTDERMDGRQTVTLRLPLDAASIINGTLVSHNIIQFLRLVEFG